MIIVEGINPDMSEDDYSRKFQVRYAACSSLGVNDLTGQSVWPAA